MKCFALAFFLAGSAAAMAADGDLPRLMSLDDETREKPQDLELDKQRPDDSNPFTPMEFFYLHSQLEAGTMYMTFSDDLDLKSHLGFYVRYGVEVVKHVSVHLTYRYNEFGNGPNTPTQEDVRLQSLFFGAGIHIPLHPEFAFVAGGGIGPMWFDSSAVANEMGFGITGEAALTAKLWTMLNLKVGLVVDGVNTDFHDAGFSLNLSYLVGLEIGM